MEKKVSIELAGRKLTIETGRLAKQAGGSVLVTYGQSVVLVTATAAREPKENIDFLPLTIEYQERFYAVGRIPGSFFRREIGRPTENETLACRIIDRPLRPLFAQGYQHETQIIATVLSADQENDPDLMAMLGASAALSVSQVPFLGPIAGVRVGMIDGQYVLNPSQEQRKNSRLDLIVAGSEKAVVMVEGGADSLSEEEVKNGIFFAHESLQPLLAMQKELQAAAGKPKLEVKPRQVDEALRQRVQELAATEMAQVITTVDKQQRGEASAMLEEKVLAALEGELAEAAGEQLPVKLQEAKGLLKELKKKMIRERITKERIRIDNRRLDEVRNITNEVGVLPRVHGSSLFTRGETQVLVSATLGSGEDEQRIESLSGMSFKPFMLHYNFPPYCVGEVRFLRGPSRRDIGHGALAERAVQAVLPDAESFPYTIRVVSEVLESNGSSSMATVCGASLSLMDAGVPMKKPVSGIAMGLIKEGDDIAILSDILGDEDHLGDMDFKVAGTEDGITALQMDIKLEGVSREIMSAALNQAREGRLHILGKMKEAIAAPRSDVPAHAPKMFSITINPDKIRDLIGPGGKVIKAITTEYGIKMDVSDDGKVKIFAPTGEIAEKVKEEVLSITAEAEVGKVYKGVVQKVMDFGAFVQILPGTDGLVHISELEHHRVNKVTDVLNEGDEVMVKVLEIDPRGKIRLSRKALLNEDKS
ncbi:polyribonucleotide nucleotidyltransferase [Desulfurivibrio alkaliphilus AHT 2]|uniref:Polyribonucleotide nucleotidyltransferase n=2 Tax=Desulfurivibrio alkaliphilus TaxID=427923 RepID=D6Z4T0_DESAT|nr:polyribonucleotide nucleotidyltransferase [Desulfurivibrio alkaliphilus]ADH86555.1 polyribonucleotide nucleotidyltransferase [Desulfurivibrio alkaliphilus AHT 2]